MNKRAIETLNAAGAFEDLEKNRAKVAKNVERLIEFGARIAQDRAAGQVDMFGGASSEQAAHPLVLADAPAWGLLEMLDNELAAAGFYLSGHPLDDFTRSACAPQRHALDAISRPARKPMAAPKPALPQP